MSVIIHSLSVHNCFSTISFAYHAYVKSTSIYLQFSLSIFMLIKLADEFNSIVYATRANPLHQ